MTTGHLVINMQARYRRLRICVIVNSNNTKVFLEQKAAVYAISKLQKIVNLESIFILIISSKLEKKFNLSIKFANIEALKSPSVGMYCIKAQDRIQ